MPPWGSSVATAMRSSGSEALAEKAGMLDGAIDASQPGRHLGRLSPHYSEFSFKRGQGHGDVCLKAL